MMTWLSANLVNIVILAVLAVTVGFVIRGMIRNKKAGKSSCGCSGCSGCSGGRSCVGCAGGCCMAKDPDK